MNPLPEPDDALIEGLARVVAFDSEQVWLAAEQPVACGSCATRSACGSGSSSAKSAARWRVPRSLIPDLPPLAVGDSLRIGVDRRALARATLTAYAVPLLTMLLAAAALESAGNAAAIAAAVAGLLAGVAVAQVLTRRWREALLPLVLGRAAATPGTSCAAPASPVQAGALRGIEIAVIHTRSL